MYLFIEILSLTISATLGLTSDYYKSMRTPEKSLTWQLPAGK